MEYLKRNSTNAAKLPDIVLLDIRMPFINGWQYLEKYCELKPILVKDTRHYACTSSMERFDIDFESRDLHGYYVKPLAPKDILKIVKDTEEHHPMS